MPMMDGCVEPLEHLAKQIAELARCIDKLTHTWLTRIREFDARDGWAESGCVSMVAWLAWWTGIGNKAASEHVRVARALGRLPLLERAFEAGELSYSKVRALTRVAEPASQQSLLDVAKAATASQLEKIVGGLRRVRDSASEENAIRVVPRRYVRFTETEDGMVRIVAQLGPEDALVVQAALEQALARGEDSKGAHKEDAASRSSAEASRRAAGAETQRAGEGFADALAAEQADALVAIAQSYVEGTPSTRGTACQVIMMTTPEQLERGPEGIGGFLRDGTPLPLHVARMLACDAARVDVSVSESGQILDVGRARRTIPAAIGRALVLRDGGCRVPGCGRPRHLHAHHVEAWAEGGSTAVSNLVLLCPGHHALVHEGKLQVAMRAGKLEFRNRYGLTIGAAPQHEIDPAVLEALGASLDSSKPAGDGVIQWDGSRLDLHEVIGWMMLSEGFRTHMH